MNPGQGLSFLRGSKVPECMQFVEHSNVDGKAVICVCVGGIHSVYGGCLKWPK